MNDMDKLRVLLPHWLEHNRGHGREFAKWAELMHAAGRGEIAELLERAEAWLQEADAALAEALRKSGGKPGDDHHHHHHHNFPE
ncbi:MAG: hypothetical protein RBR09_05250 [Desulfobulbaceae bacterium]|jgi:hypothetical protein|nr:hypothetical protein [Desulfobulbaceae bacterium]MDY0350643.1 hypothetical protein [Desulfobulbaceae bacterium]